MTELVTVTEMVVWSPFDFNTPQFNISEVLLILFVHVLGVVYYLLCCRRKPISVYQLLQEMMKLEMAEEAGINAKLEARMYRLRLRRGLREIVMDTNYLGCQMKMFKAKTSVKVTKNMLLIGFSLGLVLWIYEPKPFLIHNIKCHTCHYIMNSQDTNRHAHTHT